MALGLSMVLDGLGGNASSIQDGLQQLGQFQNEFETVFCVLAQQLPRLGIQVQQVANQLNNIFSHGKEDVWDNAFRSTCQITTAFKEELSSLLETNQTILMLFAPLVDALQAIIRTTHDLEALSFNLKLIGINARCMAIRVGMDGLAFAALTRELTGLTEESAIEYQRVQALSQDIQLEMNNLITVQKNMEEMLNQLMGDGEKKVDQVCAELRSAIEQAKTNLTTTADQSNRVFYGVKQIMLAIQRQDLQRQGINHVALILSELVEELGRLEEIRFEQSLSDIHSQIAEKTGTSFLFQERAGVLGADLMSRIEQEIERLVNEISGLTIELEVIANSLRDTRQQLDRKAKNGFAIPALNLQKLVNYLQSHFNLCHQYQGIIAKLTTLSESISSHLHKLQSMAQHLNNINQLIKIEAAHVDSLKHANQTAVEINSASKKFEGFIHDTNSALTLLAQQLAQLHTAARHMTNGSKRFHLISEQVENHVKDMQNLSQTFQAQVYSLGSIGDGIPQELGDLKKQIIQFAHSIGKINQVRDICLFVSQHAKKKLNVMQDRLGCNIPIELPAGKFQELIMQFTFLAHKEIAGEITNVEIEKGDQGGELTLF